MKKLSLSKQAEYYAKLCHEKTNHKYDGQPYAVHLQMVHDVAKGYIHLIPLTKEEVVLAACWAHDVIEDCRQTYNDVKKMLGSEVADIVFACTNEKGKTRKDRANDKFYRELNEVPYANFVKICDRIANMRYSLAKGSQMALMYAKERKRFSEEMFTSQYEPMFLELSSLSESAIEIIQPENKPA